VADELNVKIVVDASQLNAGMQQAAGAVESASVKMAQSLKAAGVSSADAASALKNLGFSAAETSTALQSVGLVAAQAAAEVETTTASLTGMDRAMAMATGRIVGFGAGAGMLGGALARVGAASSVLGPALAAAFPVIAAVALVDIVSKIPQVFQEIIDSIAGWDKASKKAYADLIASNNEMLLENAKLKIEAEALNEIGAKGAQKYAIAAKNNADALSTWAQVSTELLGEQKSLNAELEKLSSGGYKAYDSIAKALHAERIAEIRTELEGIAKNLETVDRTQRSLSGVAAPKIIDEKNAAQIEDARKALENLARETDRQGKEAEEAAVKRGDAERHAIEEKERLDEEADARSTEMAKRDLETWQRSLVQKTAITEEEGKNALAQIRANAELAEKATAQKSIVGGASPAISQEALAATQQEAAVIQQLIAAEDELQQKLIATGAAQDDPKILDSQRRQLELTQQMSKAWDDYAKKVEQVTTAQTAIVKQETNSLFSSINSNLVQMVNGQESIGRGIQKIWTGLVDSIIVDFAKLGEKWIMQHVIMAAASKLFHLQDAASAATSAAAATAAAKVAGVAQVGLAGAGGVASMAAAPFPIDTTAPAFGVSMAASAAGMLAFHEGGIVPGSGEVPALLMGGEQVLTKEQQGERGGHVFNYHQTINGNADSDVLGNAQKNFVKTIKRELRRMHR
jgi:hypothetical protein